MAESEFIQIERATPLEGEAVFLEQLVDDQTSEEKRLVYADWLEEQGESDRAGQMRQFSNALKSGNAADFPDVESTAWTRMTGLRLVSSIIKRGFSEHIQAWLRLARPALSYEGEDSSDDDIPVGGSKLFGLPDLPPSISWPTASECEQPAWADAGLDPDGLCGFLGQINLAELAGTQVARDLPRAGLLSFFAFQEYDTIGTVDAHLIYTQDLSELKRVEPPGELDEANELRDPQTFVFAETLDLPEKDGPWKDQVGLGKDYEQYERYREVWDDCGCDGLQSLLGYLQSTSGDDPTTDATWRKLICIETGAESMLHFQIHETDLKSGTFSRSKLAWVDFD